MQGAIEYYAEAARLDPEEKRYQENLESAQKWLKEKQEWQRKEDQFAGARTKVGNMLDNLADKMGTQDQPVHTSGSTSELEFITEKEPVVSKGSQSSAPVALGERSLPQDLKAGQPEKGLAMKDVPLPRVVPEWDPWSVKSTGEIVIDALAAGKKDNKTGPSDLDKSILYLDRYLNTQNPDNVKVQDAVSYLEGMRARAGTQVKKKPGIFDPSNDDTQRLMEAIAGKKVASIPAPKSPQPGGAGPNPNEWRFQRDQAIKDAVKQGKGDLKVSIGYLENKLKGDKYDTDIPSRHALKYLEAYNSYQEFSLKEAKPQQLKK